MHRLFLLALAIGAGLASSACTDSRDTSADDAGAATAAETSGAATADPDSGTTSAAGSRPNILLIVADDLGYSDLGLFGSEIPTPNIDALARGGMTLTQFYAHVACQPTRAMLLSGTDNHIAGLGAQGRPRNAAQIGQPGYEGYLNFRVASLAELLADSGYHTYMAGKWHLGAEVETGPRARGFERSFVSIDGAAHLGGLSWNGPGTAPYRDGEELVTVGDDFYSTRFYTERMIEYIEESRGDDQPFFAYLAYTAPHWPLQAPPESVARFRGRYDAGYEALYAERLARAKALGQVAPDYPGKAPPPGQPAWDDLTPDEQRVEARKMEIYAAMVSDLDTYIGRMLDYLRTTGELDDTFVMFISDNGPEASRADLGEAIARWVEQCCDNRYENLGNGNSYVMYGPNWARASAVPFRAAKSTTFDGGTHVPAIVSYPGYVAAGAESGAFATVMDVLPTLLELAGSEHPGAEYRGRAVVAPRGVSMLPVLTGDSDRVHAPESAVGWELGRHRAIRQADWKIVFDPREGDAAPWRLFNVGQDPAELTDLAATEPERLAAMLELWAQYVRETGVIEPQ